MCAILLKLKNKKKILLLLYVRVNIQYHGTTIDGVFYVRLRGFTLDRNYE